MSTNNQLAIDFGVSVLQKIVDAGYDFYQPEQDGRNMIIKATERYVKGLIERFGEIKIMGMNQPIPLLTLYVRVNILEKVTTRIAARVEDLERFFDYDNAFAHVAHPNRPKTKDAEEIANHLLKFIVLGKPGAGKTTFLKYIALASINKESTVIQRRLPIFITLRDWADKHIGLIDYITDLFEFCDFKEARLFSENILQQGKCLILFDGLDEVSDETNLDNIIRDILDLTYKYSGNQFVISCRKTAYDGWFNQFTDVEIADFNITQIETFVNNWFASEDKTAKECFQRLRAIPQLRELSTLPLLLTLLCNSYEANNDFPNNRAELYQEAIDALFRKWDASRRIRRDDGYNQLTTKQKEIMFARIAYGTLIESQYFFRESELRKMIENFIANLPAFKKENLEVNSADILRTIESHHGIFVERAKYIHSFAHLTFHEYFAAQYILNHSSDGILEDLIKRYFYDKKWKEVFILIAGMMHDSNELLLLMLKKNRSLLLDSLVLNSLLELTEKALLSEKGKYTVNTRKVIVVYMVLALASVDNGNPNIANETDSARAFSLDLARVLERDSGRSIDIEMDLARALSRDLDLNIYSSIDFEVDADIDIDIDIVLNMDLSINKDLIHNFISSSKFAPEQIGEISLFLKGNALISRCLTSAAFIAKPTRDLVLSKMLLPLTEEELNLLQ